jgi:hypothetical protein
MENKMFKRFIPALLAIAVLLTACGPQGTPTMSAADVQGTAVSSAWTMVAQTQLAIPTATPLPPTETPTPTALPTDTPIPSPTLDPALVLAPTSTKSGDPCDQPLVASPDGKMTRLRLQNETGAPVTFSIYLIKTPFGACGYRGYSLKKGERLFIDFPQGCYYFWAIVNDPKKPSNASGGGENICANNNDLWMVRIGKEIINLASP